MKNGLKKLWPALAAFTTLASVTCSADDMQMRNLENRVCALEQRRGANGMINPPARPVVRDGIDLWAQVEALYMHATEDGLAYAIRNNDLDVASITVDGNVKNVKYNWNWGFRAGLGYNLPHDGWDVLLNWTRFRSHKKASEKHTPANLLATQASPAGANAFFNTAKGASSLHFNLLDFEMGREFFVSKWLTLRPFVGVRASWLNRNFQTRYVFNELANIRIKGHDHNRFRGAGLRAGLDTQWGLGCGWSFFGDLALSLIYGTQRLHSHQDTTFSSGAKFRTQHVHDHWLTARGMLDLAAGIRWDHLLGNCDAYRIRIQLGWEQTSMFGFDKDLNFVNADAPGKYTQNSGDLAISGVSLQFRFDF
jgi:hypothetical protein